MEVPNCLQEKPLKVGNIFLTLEDGEGLIRKGISRGTGQRRVQLLGCYRLQTFFPPTFF